MSKKALAHLRTADPKLGAYIDRVGPYRPNYRTAGTHFDAVVRSIVYQQLSGAAASTIHGRVMALYGDASPTAAQLLRTPVEKLRAAGLSGRKVEYLHALAKQVKTRALPIESLHELDDDAVIDTLTQVRGVGRWTAQMVLMFRLKRPDVLAELDLGLQKGLQKVHGLRSLPSAKRLAKVGERWAPWRSVASWYLWRSLELDD
ncbi:MAG: DNA-3-methyladenine glycosylase 2 family protein [Gemmatimonadetes bacterium]|nr:DNA-3-methyladenine glycosylase 2 family protein [Gemmatimonadota bacterium]MBI3568287.1 DNA-3-methyladenine glycosylase 2 family protein [Gemmatimonadota bacterium]